MDQGKFYCKALPFLFLPPPICAKAAVTAAFSPLNDAPPSFPVPSVSLSIHASAPAAVKAAILSAPLATAITLARVLTVIVPCTAQLKHR